MPVGIRPPVCSAVSGTFLQTNIYSELQFVASVPALALSGRKWPRGYYNIKQARRPAPKAAPPARAVFKNFYKLLKTSSVFRARKAAIYAGSRVRVYLKIRGLYLNIRGLYLKIRG